MYYSIFDPSRVSRLFHGSGSHCSGLQRLDTGALVKDYEAADKETTHALQLAVSQVTFEDERYIASRLLSSLSPP